MTPTTTPALDAVRRVLDQSSGFPDNDIALDTGIADIGLTWGDLRWAVIEAQAQAFDEAADLLLAKASERGYGGLVQISETVQILRLRANGGPVTVGQVRDLLAATNPKTKVDAVREVRRRWGLGIRDAKYLCDIVMDGEASSWTARSPR